MDEIDTINVVRARVMIREIRMVKTVISRARIYMHLHVSTKCMEV
jgi:hypothetical protein